MKKYSASILGAALLSIWAAVAVAQSAAAPAVAPPAAKKHPFEPPDWASLHSAQPIAVAPDGNTILSRVDFGAARGRTQHEWKLIAADGSHPRTLNLPKKFTPFGFTRDAAHLYGALEQHKHQQLATLSITTPEGQPQVLTSLPSGISRALLSPDGSRFAVLADPRPLDPLADVRTVVENPQTSLYIVDTDGSRGTWWCPALKQVAAIAWAPDDPSLAVLSQTPMIGYHDMHSSIDVCSASGARNVAQIANAAASEAPQGPSAITWTRDGKQLVFLSTRTHVLTPDHVWSVPASGGTPVDRTPNLAGSALAIDGDARGHVWVFVTRGVRGEVDSFADGKLTPAYQWPEGTVMGFPVAPELASAPPRLAFAVSDPAHAPNVAVVEDGRLQRITKEGDDELASIELGAVKVVSWTSKEGIHLEGIATFPPDYVAGKKYHFLVFPHGGPEANDFLMFDSFARFLSDRGYVVLQPEYRGSTGYGSSFLEAIYQHFGSRAYRDVQSATDFAVAQGWADPNHLAILGWSAGGFMTAWTVTQTHRYRAAIEGAGITDWLSFMWTSDIPQFDYDARWPDQDPQAFLRFSPVLHSADVTTPLLIMDGTADLRVPTDQGRELYLVLAARGKTVRQILYPGSPHFPIVWEQRQDVLREVAGWLSRYNP